MAEHDRTGRTAAVSRAGMLMALPALLPVPKMRNRLQKVFPEGTPNRNNCTWEIAAKTVFVTLYVGAVEGADKWLRPDQVTRMTDKQANRTDNDERLTSKNSFN